MPVTTLPIFFVGDVVTTPSTGSKLYRITKVNPVNLKVEDEAGNRYTLNQYGALKSTETFNAAPKPPTAQFSLGDLVTVNSPKFPGLYVVIKRLSPDRFSLTKINSGADDVLRAPVSTMTRVELP